MLIELLGNAVADFPLVGQEMSKVMSVNDSCMALLQQTPLMDNSREMENFVRQEKELSVVMENLFAVCEQHPEWKVGEHLPRLKREYGVSRHQLARLHHSYNVAVCVYNDTIHAFLRRSWRVLSIFRKRRFASSPASDDEKTQKPGSFCVLRLDVRRGQASTGASLVQVPC